MSTFEFLIGLKNQGIDISINGERLKLNAPKGTLTPALKEELSHRKEEIIQFLKKADEIGDQPQPAEIEPVDRNNPLPISPAQERVWSLFQLDPTSTALNIPVIWKLTGVLNPERLENALDAMIARQEILRSYYPVGKQGPQTKILSHYQSNLQRIRLDDLPNPENEALRLLNEEVQKRPFDITQAPPHRFVLYQVGPQASILLLNFHQIIFDWSAHETVVTEINSHYNHHLGDNSVGLPELSLQYVDYAYWQQKWRRGDQADSLNQYWHQKLSSPYQLLQIPKTNHEASPNISKINFSIEAEMAGPLRRLCQSHGTTMFVLMLTAVKVLFSKFAPEEEVMLFTSTGQNKVGHSNLIGLFANLILLRTSLKGNPSFPTLLKRVKETTLSAIAHQNLPFEDMLDHLQWQSITGNNNLFQLIFIYQQPYQVSLQLEGVSSELMSAGEHLGAFDIRFFLEDNGKSLLGEIEYNTAQYGSALVQSLVEKLTSILEIIVTDENVSLDTLVVQQKTAVLPIPPPLTNHLPPRDEIEAQLLVLWQEILKTDAIGIRDNFFDLGGHSLLAARLFAKIHKTLGKNLPLASLIHSPTIEALAKLIKDDTGEREWQSLIPIQSGGQKPPLFLVHGAGGNILLYRDLAEALGPDQPVFGLQARGLDGRGDYFTDFKAMAAHYLQEIKIIQPEGPYLLGGYCLGGALAYEMAQQLHQAGQETALVAMFETFNIHANPATYDGTYKTIHKLQNLWFHTDNILKLPLKGKFAFFREKFAVQKQRTKQKISLMVQKRNNSVNDEELIHLLIDKINDDAHEAYRPQTYQGQVAVFRPIKDFKGMEDPAYGWGELIPKEKLIVKYLKVNPKGMMVTPFSKDLARQLSQLIDASLREAKQEGNGQPV